MRLDYIHFNSAFKNLEGLKIDFNQHKELSVIIGRNGTAKTNLFEAIIIIFADIALKRPGRLSYELQYFIKGKQINIKCEFNSKPTVHIDGSKTSLDSLISTWLPRYLVAYYSGTSDRFSHIFVPFDKLALKETLKDRNETGKDEKLDLRRFIYARREHSLFLILAFYFIQDSDIESFLKDKLRIEGFDSCLLTIRRPYWAKKNASVEEFWGSDGPVYHLIKRIRSHSLAPISLKKRINRGYKQNIETELLYLFIPDITALLKLSDEYSNDPNALFQALDTMRLSDLIEDVEINVKVRDVNRNIYTRGLSEGEQQIITVMGLLRFTKSSDSLYLLDEPDTHLNPSWTIDYTHYLKTVGGILNNSHTLISTHSPLLVAGLCKDEIIVMSRDNKGKISSSNPEESPRGTGIASVLTSPLYGLESQLDRFSLSVLKRIYEISLQPHSETRNRHLIRLRKLLPSLDIIESSPDPYRNIAREAYRIAHQEIGRLEPGSSVRITAADRLSEKLYNESVDLS